MTSWYPSDFGLRLVFNLCIRVRHLGGLYSAILVPVPTPVSMPGMEVLGSGEPIDSKHLSLCLCLCVCVGVHVVGVVVYLSFGKRVVVN